MQFRLNILYINSIKCSELLLQKPKIKNQFRYIEQYHTNFYYSDSQSFSWTVFIRRINQLKIYIFGLSQTFSSTLQQFVNPVSFSPPPPPPPLQLKFNNSTQLSVYQRMTNPCNLQHVDSSQCDPVTTKYSNLFRYVAMHYKRQQFVTKHSNLINSCRLYILQQFNTSSRFYKILLYSSSLQFSL